MSELRTTVPFLAALLAGTADGQQYVIDFDSIGSAATVTTGLFPEAIFTALDPAHELRAYAARLGSSAPNCLCTSVEGSITCRDGLAVDFPTPVKNLSFLAVGVNRKGRVAEARVYVNGALAGTEEIRGRGRAKRPVLVDLSAYSDVTRVEIADVHDRYGVGWDDFAFEIEQVPTFDPPTPCQANLVAVAGTPLAFQVVASDPATSDVLTLEARGVPAGAQLLPPLPTSGNPVATSFSWTPGAGDLGPHLVSFTVADGDTPTVTCTVTIDVQCPSTQVHYGAGVAGSGGFLPVVSATCPVAGDLTRLEVRDGPGGALGCLAMGTVPASIPLRGGRMLVDPTSGTSHTHVLSGTLPGEGSYSLPMIVPPALAMSGTPFYFQGGYLDPGAVGGVALTDGLEVTIR